MIGWRAWACDNAVEKDSDLSEVAALAGGAALATAICAIATGLRFANADALLTLFGEPLAALGVLNLYQALRMPGNKRLIFLINVLIIYFFMSAVLLVYQYALALTPAYPISTWIHNADAALGFRWINFSQLVHSVPNGSEILAFCYQNWIRETFLIVLVLSALGQYSRLREFAASYIFAGMAAISVTGWLHAQSYDSLVAFSTMGAHAPTGFNFETFEKAQRLRSGADHILDGARLIGLVCFPSFHACSAVLMATAMRGVKRLWLPCLIFSDMVIIGTITEGGHNFVDVIAGCLVAVFAVAAAQAYLKWGGVWRRLCAIASRRRFEPQADEPIAA